MFEIRNDQSGSERGILESPSVWKRDLGHQVLAEQIWDDFFFYFVFCWYKHCVVPWVVTVLRHQLLGTEVLAVFRDAT